ncbi:ankyrin repeat domain-containing protein [Aspergillus mulundensis]|uniref:Uncharacterized protein n=1 Tax=Aspergillus mulundensis TaxID=1810919 RepID=A0A3D8SUG1_9EURO|nr:hypothetical protein DSM5745_01700 [Aspergillus mulundensis]RDW89925.1 hypothetical protein DSM5745_01700 [Aspergillus mulundensis]
MPLDALPDNVIAGIASHILSPADLASFARATRHVYNITKLLLTTRKDVLHKLDQTLVHAVQTSNVQLCTSALRDGANPSIRMDRRKTPLMFAAESGQTEIVQLLLSQKGVDPNLAGRPDGATPLHAAVQAGQHEVVHILLATEGVDPDSRDRNGHTPLMLASSSPSAETADIFLDLARRGIVDPNAKTETGATALHRAALNGRAAVVRQLLDLGADPDPVDEYSHATPLILASRARAEEAATLLLELARRGLVDPHRADRDGQTALHKAARFGRAGVVRQLLALGADVNALDSRKDTPLLLAVRELQPVAQSGWDVFSNGPNDSRLFRPGGGDNARLVEVVEMLLGTGRVRIHHKAAGESALTVAERKGMGDIVEMLKAAAPLEDQDDAYMSGCVEGPDPALRRACLTPYLVARQYSKP